MNERPAREEIATLTPFLRRSLSKMIAKAGIDGWLAARLDHDAIVQETVRKAIEAYDKSTEPIRVIKSWITVILFRTLIDAARRVDRRGLDPALDAASSESIARLEMLAADQTSPSDGAIRNEEERRLIVAMRLLPEDERRVIELCKLEEPPMTSGEAAEILGTTDAAVRGLLARAMQRLHNILEEGRLNAAMRLLPEDERRVIELCKLEEPPMTPDAVAEILGTTAASVRELLALALKRLHKKLKA
jgi:RNA polymerase sigma-70 factor (ECF subfamily)